MKSIRQDMQTKNSATIESRRTEILAEREALIQKIKDNLKLENQSKEEKLRVCCACGDVGEGFGKGTC